MARSPSVSRAAPVAALLFFGCAATCPPCEGPAGAPVCAPGGAEASAQVVRLARWYPSFNAARAQLETRVYADHRVDLYCGCAYDETGAIDAASCGYQRRRPGARGCRIEWARAVPAARFGAHRDCWDDPECSETGRECCARPVERGGDQQFRWMLGDMHNLVPVIGELNADRSDRDYGVVEGEPRDYGACDFEIDRASADGLVEPPEAVRGDVARIWFYMWHTYPTRWR